MRYENWKVQYPIIGEVQFVPSVSAKYIRISLKSSGIVRVTVPKRASIKEAMAFVETKMKWILKIRSQIPVHERTDTIFTPVTAFKTHCRQLQLIPWKSEQFRCQISKDTLKIFYPNECDLQSDKSQVIIREFIISTLRKEAKEYLPQRTEKLATAHGFTFNGITVKNISSRWGSCSATNHINLNIHLVRLPEHLSDYVILHELTHTVHKNHSERFWNHLNMIIGGKAKYFVEEMKKYNVGL